MIMTIPVQHFKPNGAPPRRMIEQSVTALELRPVGRGRGLLDRGGVAARPSPFHLTYLTYRQSHNTS